MVEEKQIFVSYFSEYSSEDKDTIQIEEKTLTKSIRLTLFMSLIQGFNERLFYSMLLFGYFARNQLNSLNSEWILFSQHFLKCIGFLLWGIICNYLKPSFVLSISFFLWGLISIIQPFASSFISLLFCRYILSISYAALEPSVQTLAEEYFLKKKNLGRFFGAVSCYRNFGSFLATSYVTMMHMYRSEKSFEVYSRNIWIISGLTSISVSIIIIISIFTKYKEMENKSIYKLTFRENFKDSFQGCKTSVELLKRDRLIITSAIFVLFIVGLFSSIVSEIYNSFHFTSSFYFKKYGTLINGTSETEAYLIALNLTYYTLKSVIFLSGSAIGSLSFGISYYRIHFFLKKTIEKYQIEFIDGIEKKNFKSLYCISIILASILFIMNLVILQFLLEIPKILKFTIIEIVDDSVNFGWIALHLIGIFTMGSFLTIIIDIILRLEVIILNKNNSVIFYGIYLTTIGLLSNSSLYRYLNIFKPDENYVVKISNVSKINILPTIFNYPIKLFFPSYLINKIMHEELSYKYIHIQEMQMSASICSILFYVFTSFILVSFLVLKLTKYKKLGQK